MTSPAYSLTGRGMASALLCRPRAKQTVHIACKVFSGGKLVFPVRVLVDGAYFAVYSKGALEALKGGSTPAYLELEPWEDGDEREEYPEYERASSAADRRHQFNKEQV